MPLIDLYYRLLSKNIDLLKLDGGELYEYLDTIFTNTPEDHYHTHIMGLIKFSRSPKRQREYERILFNDRLKQNNKVKPPPKKPNKIKDVYAKEISNGAVDIFVECAKTEVSIYYSRNARLVKLLADHLKQKDY